MESLQDFFDAKNRVRNYPKGSIIIMQGGSTDEVYRIVSGVVKVYDIDAKGLKRTVALYSAGHIMPASWLLKTAHKNGALFFYEAISAVKCNTVLRDELRTYINSRPEIYEALLDAVARAYINAAGRIQNLEHSNVRERISFILYYLAVLHGKKTESGKFEIDAALSHQEIADMAGLTRETVTNEIINNDKYRNVIKKTSGKTLLDLRRLDFSNAPNVFKLNL